MNRTRVGSGRTGVVPELQVQAQLPMPQLGLALAWQGGQMVWFEATLMISAATVSVNDTV
jgi:hypothetical protein